MAVLKQAELGMPVAELIRQVGISEQTFYRWRNKFGGMDVAEARRLKEFESENERLKRLIVLKMLCVIDEYTRECLAIEVGASLRSQDVILVLSGLMRLYGKPAFIRSDNGAEFTAARVMHWLRDASIGPAFQWFRSRAEARVFIEQWRQFYNERRPHSAHRYQPPATVRRVWLESDNIDMRLTA